MSSRTTRVCGRACSCRCSFVLSEGQQTAVMVPKEAIYNVAGLTKMFVIRDGTRGGAEDLRRVRNSKAGWKCRAKLSTRASRSPSAHLTQLVTGTPVKISREAEAQLE